MREPKSFGRFLEENPRFEFDLIEHVHAAEVIAEARAGFEAFRRSVDRAVQADPWRARRGEVRAAAEGLRAYEGVDWAREDYESTIPLIDKSALRMEPDAFVRPGLDRRRLWMRPTSGTSGPPVTVYYDAPAFAELQYFSACVTLCYTDLLPKALDGRPIFTLSVLDNTYLQDRVWTDPSGMTGATLRVVFDTADPGAVMRLADLVRRHQPAVLSLKPNILRILLDGLGPAARRLNADLIAIVSGGAELSPALRTAAQKQIGVPVVDAYGMSEVGAIASSCTHGKGLHINEGAIICEVLREENAIAWTGVGELVVSAVNNRAMPILRYRTGDFAQVTDRPCRCGRPGRRLMRLMGRQAPSFKMASGGYFAPTNLNPLFDAFGLRELQVTQLSIADIEVKVEFTDTSGPPPLEAVRAAAQRIAGDQFDVRVTAATFQQGEKFQRYRTLL